MVRERNNVGAQVRSTREQRTLPRAFEIAGQEDHNPTEFGADDE